MSELVPSLISLDKGLSLQTAKIVTPPGSVLDTLNYEQVDFQGQKRIDGFARYDGNLLSTIDEYYKITGLSGSVSVNDILYNGDVLLGRVVGTDEAIFLAVIDENALPVVGDELFVFADGTLNSVGTVGIIASGTDSAATVEEHYQNLLAFNTVLRTPVEELPGNIIGLHWFRDRLYAVADVAVAALDYTTPVIYPNDRLSITGQEDVKVLDSYVRGLSRLVFLETLDPTPWAVAGTAVTRDGDPVGNISVGVEEINVDEEIASFFESRTEAQVIEEDGPSGPYDFGWRFVDQGWAVNFEEGLSLFGSLPSLNQNIIGLGEQGPTTTAGNNGMPLILTQKVSITNDVAQVNGWKSSQTPLTYELETDNFIETDDDTIYADAYISWNGTTGEVVGVTGPLVEYPATNTVIVEGV